MATKYIPDGFHTVTPYLVVDDPGALIDFLVKAFDAEELERATLPDGRVMHAQVRIGDSPVMMGGSKDDWKAMTNFMHLYVPDTDKLYEQALAAGATSVQAPNDEFYGDRAAGITDPAGNTWWIATHVEDVSDEEAMKRMEAAKNG